jgi:hypothetical protein
VEIQVAAYHVRVKKRYSSHFEMLDALGGNNDFLEFLETCFKKWRSAYDNDAGVSRVAKLEKFERVGRAVQGRIQVGDYGQACDVIDANEPQRVVFTKGVQHADILPFFFRCEVPENRDEALLLIEKSRRTSPKTAFVRHPHGAFKIKFPEHTLSINPVMPQEVFEKYLSDGGVQKIEFIRMGLPNDIADILESGHREAFKRVKTKLVITAGRKDTLPLKKSLLKKPDPRQAIADLYELKDFEYQDIAVTVRIGKNTRKVDLGNRHALPLYNISDEVKPGRDGIAPYDSMAKAFRKLADDIREGAYAAT